MMIGPMKKKVITSAVVTGIALIIIFAAIAGIYVTKMNEKVAELTKKGEVVQRYVFIKDMLAGEVVTASDVLLVDVKGESSPTDSYDNKALGSIIGRRLKINAGQRTIATDSMFFVEDSQPAIDTRLQEFNMITLPSDLKEGDFIDIRLRYPTGEDFAVIVGKKIEGLGATEAESNTIFLRLSEEEISRTSSAIIDSYIRDGIKLYANKYVDPANQLFDYERINYVERFENARYAENIVEASGEPILDESGEVIGTNPSTSTVKEERTAEDIAVLIGLDLSQTKKLKEAYETNNKETLEYYKSVTVAKAKSITPNYPVKPEVARLIANNPNILNEIRAKYNVEKLIQERINILDTSLTSRDSYTGELTDDNDKLSKINEKLNAEIETQRTERQEYLLNLLSKQSNVTSTENVAE